MNWWHRAHTTALTTAVLTTTMLLAPLLEGSVLPIPSLLAGTSAGVPVALVLPAAPAALILHALNRVPRVYDTTAVRPTAGYKAGMLGAAALLTTVLSLAGSYVADSSMPLAAARNVVGYLGAGLIVQYLAGRQYGPLTVALVPVLCALIGLGPGGRPFSWTWPLHEATSPLAAVTATILFAAGVTGATVLAPQRDARRPATG
ncbi:hypothetical protein STHAL_25770 [Streptomyces halstedii]|uniref:ABC transporter n=1 Tax=Streptomyces halstedii TaxID=1944 RepID=A0ABS6TX72_STRHA|nr:hypothetical protein [Streptomyces halstedii]MBV7672856.1 hypothetical protein [Streptomyces halstedii]